MDNNTNNWKEFTLGDVQEEQPRRVAKRSRKPLLVLLIVAVLAVAAVTAMQTIRFRSSPSTLCCSLAISASRSVMVRPASMRAAPAYHGTICLASMTCLASLTDRNTLS